MNNQNMREREELHKKIWSIADDLRGSVDGWDFKQYILGMMFYRYISENITNYINEGERKAGDKDFDYAKLPDEVAETQREELVKEKGFFILPSELFCNVCKKAKNDENLNETLEKVFNNIENSAKGAESEDDFAGLFDDIDVNSNKLGATVAKRNDKLVKILNGIADIKLDDYKSNSIDAFGDAYEFLMSMYASNAGKSGGEFFTPQEVSELLTRLAVVGKTSVNKVYDPACGSGSLLLKSAKILGKENVRNGFFGQEINLTTYNLCRINMFLHDIGYDKFNIACEDTLTNPQHWDDEPFEVIVSNPPYSIKWAGDENPLLINDPRYSPAGVLAPKSKADFAFIMHSLSWLATNGTASIVCFPGILYRGGAEQKIRKYLVDNNFIDCIIQLPDNLFYGTGIATCIMVLKKNKKENNVLFINASNEFKKVGTTNKLLDTNIFNIMNFYEKREDKEFISKVVSNNEIADNDYILSTSSYVEVKNSKFMIDIESINNELHEIENTQANIRRIVDNDVNKISNKDKENISEVITNLCNCKVKFIALSEAFEQFSGMSGVSNKWKENGNCKFIDYMNAYKNLKINTELLRNATVKNLNQNTLKKGDLLLTSASETPDECALSSVIENDIDDGIFMDDHLFGLRLKEKYNNIINPIFINYYMHTEKFRNQVYKAVRGVTRYYISTSAFLRLKIPIIPIDVQNRVVCLLDNFIMLSEQLQKENEKRLKQFEYYKNSLLNFGVDKNETIQCSNGNEQFNSSN